MWSDNFGDYLTKPRKILLHRAAFDAVTLGRRAMFNKKAILALAAATFAASPLLAQGLGHTFFMRGSIVGTDARGKIICLGKADGASEGEVLEVYRVTPSNGPSKGAGTGFRRDLVGHVRIDHIFDDHFVHATAVDGKPAPHDIVELKKA